MIRTRIWSVFVVSAILAGVAGESSVVLAQRQPAAAAARPAAAAETTPDDRIARGRYIVEDVATCWRCHSPVLQNGERDTTHWLMGGQVGVTPTVPSGNWAIVAPRIAGVPPGTDEQIVHLLMTGISRNGGRLRLPMPQFRMSQSDAEAVVAYLKSLGGHIPNTTR
ncbi:MAG: hypothetical protein U0Q11_09890 [Vicinamibacterales bacterium]